MQPHRPSDPHRIPFTPFALTLAALLTACGGGEPVNDTALGGELVAAEQTAVARHTATAAMADFPPPATAVAVDDLPDAAGTGSTAAEPPPDQPAVDAPDHLEPPIDPGEVGGAAGQSDRATALTSYRESQ